MKYLVFDTETGGFDPAKNPIMSIGAMLLNGELELISSHYALMQNEFKREVTQRAKEVNGLDEFVLETGISPSDYVPVWSFLVDQADVLIAHNIAFDTKFMDANGFSIPERTLDTMHVAWDVWSGEKAQLDKCYERVGYKSTSAHNALYDCQMVVGLLRWFVNNGHLTIPLPSYPIVENY